MTRIYADGELWADSDGTTEFGLAEAGAIAAMLQELGCEVLVVWS